MTRRRVLTSTLIAAVSICGLTASRIADSDASVPTGTYGMRLAPLHLRSIGVMSFGSDGILYVADSRAGAVYAIDLAESERDTSTSGIMVKAVDARIATALGVSKDEIRIHDMVAHPLSQSLYFSVTKGRGDAATPLIVRLTKRDKRVSVVSLDMVRHARFELPDAASRDTTMPWEGVPRSFTMTHLAAGNGELYVAGLSNEEFKSTLRRVTLPFGKGAVTTLRDRVTDRIAPSGDAQREVGRARKLHVLTTGRLRPRCVERQRRGARQDGGRAGRRQPAVRHDRVQESQRRKAVHDDRQQPSHADALRSG